jgi:hypothetical protein
METDEEEEEQEEIILFKPARRAHPDAGRAPGLDPRGVPAECAAGPLRPGEPHAPRDGRSPYLSAGMPPGGFSTSAPFPHAPPASPGLGNGCGVASANAVWGGLGSGPAASFPGPALAAPSGAAAPGSRFEWACPATAADAACRLSEAAAGKALELVDRARPSSRFVTRNPFAN